jgi:serine/threonine protein kinase
MTQPSIPGLDSVEFLSSDGSIRAYRAVDADGGVVRAFVSTSEAARERLERWAEIEASSRWMQTDDGGALVCRWPEPTPEDPNAARRVDPRAALEACLPCLDQLVHSHELGMPHCGVRADGLHLVDGRYLLPPPRPGAPDDGLALDLRDAKRLLKTLLTPDAEATVVTDSSGSRFLADALGVLDQHVGSVIELRDRLRALFGANVEQPTIVSGQIPVVESQITLPESVAGFQIRRLLGKGGMGYVFEAYDSHLERELALKTVRLDILGEAGKERFLREARACSRINHPNIVTVYSAGEVDGDPYMAMELVRGRTLAEYLKEEQVDWRTLVGWIVQLLDALERLHSEGIVHRDLKPENIMLTADGVPKLMDFGLAHMAAAAQLTATGMMVGTVHYMSPEQVLGKEIDARSDVFSMGILLYRALSGTFPFDGDHPMSVMYAIQNAEAPKLDVRKLDVPVELAGVVAQALSKQRENRFASAGPFRDALVELVGPTREAGEPARSRLPWIVAGAVALAVSFGLFWATTRGPGGKDRGAAVQHNELGTDLESEGRLSEARAEYRRALMADDGYAVAWNNLGMLSYAEGALAEADSFLGRAAQLDEKYAIARFNRGHVLEDLGFPGRAIRSYAAAVAADSSLSEAYNNLAVALLKRGRREEAGLIIQEGLRRTDEDYSAMPVLRRTAGRVLREQGDLSGAVEQWKLSLEALPDDPRLHVYLAETLQQLEGFEAARPYWERLLELGDEEQRVRAEEALANHG